MSHCSVRAYIGEQIQQARIVRGLSVYRLGKLSGLSPTHLYGVENGDATLSLGALEKVLDALNLKLEVKKND